jgi:hypothetical protein
MKPTIKTLILGSFLLMGGLVAKKVHANNPGICHAKKSMHHHREALKAISKDVDLTQEQKEMWIEFKEEMRQNIASQKENMNKRHHKNSKHQFHKNLRSFVLGDIEAQELHEKIDRESSKMNDKIEIKQEKLYSILNILETYTEDQREQALDNLDELESQREDALENIKKIKSEKFERIFEGVDISARQLKKLESFHKEGQEEREISKQNFQDYLEGEISKETVISEMENTAQQGSEHLHDMVDIWNDLLKGLSQDDRQLIVDNMDSLHEEFKKNCTSKDKNHPGPHKKPRRK